MIVTAEEGKWSRLSVSHGDFKADWKVSILLVVLSAFLLYLSFPYPRQSWLIWIALVPLFLALHGQGGMKGLFLGLLFGFLLWGTLLNWATFFGIPAFLVLVFLKCPGSILLGLSVSSVRCKSADSQVVYWALAYVAREWIDSLGPLGVEWGMLANSQARNIILIQGVDLLGPWLLSFTIALCNALVAWVCYRALSSRWSLSEARSLFSSLLSQVKAALLALVILMGFLLAYGTYRLSYPIRSSRLPIVFGAVQVSMGRTIKWDIRYADEAIFHLKRLTLRAAEQGAEVILWPETAIPYRNFSKNVRLTMDMGELARKCAAYLIVGSIEFAEPPTLGTYNTAWLITPEGRIAQRYDKQRLVPGGEYLPLDRWLRRFAIFDRVMHYLPGKGEGIFILRLGAGSHRSTVKVGMLICYESMLGWISRQRILRGAQVMLVSTNDGWFGESSAAYHHFNMAIVRAVEYRRPFVQAGNTGISGMITPMGEVRAETDLNERTIAVAAVRPCSYLSLYARVGDILAWFVTTIWITVWLFPVKEIQRITKRKG